MNPKDEGLRVKVNWRLTTAEATPLWRRLWTRLLTDRKRDPASTHGATGDGGWKDENEGNLPNEGVLHPKKTRQPKTRG